MPLTSQYAKAGQAFSYVIPDDVTAFDVNLLESRSTGLGAVSLPAWLTYNATTRTLSGTPADENAGKLLLGVRSSGSFNGRDYRPFNLAVRGQDLTDTIFVKSSNGIEPAIVTFSNGDFVVAWSRVGGAQRNSAGVLVASGTNIVGQRYNSLGDPIGIEFVVNETFPIHPDTDPAIAILQDGGFVITWTSGVRSFKDFTTPDGQGAGVFGQRYDAAGNKLGSDFQVNTIASGDEFDSTIVALNDGGFIVAWTAVLASSNTREVRMQRYDANGVRAGSEMNIPGTSDLPSITAMVNGGFAIAGNQSVQIYDSNGVRVGNGIPTSSTNSVTEPIAANFISVSALSDGGLVALEKSFDIRGTLISVTAQRYTATGAKNGSAITLSTDITDAVVKGLANGDFVVAYNTFKRNFDGSTTRDAKAQRYDANGNAVGAALAIRDPSSSGDRTNLGFILEGLTVSPLNNGGFLATWAERVDTSNSSFDIRARIFQPTNSPNNRPPVVSTPINDQTATIGTAFSFTIPANAFSDPDAGNTLTYRATLADGSALPTWLTFDANTRTLSGTAPAGTTTGSLALRVTATDNGNLSVSDDFNVTVNNSAPVNQAPVVANAIADTTATIGTAFSFTIPANAFSDPDAGNTLTYSATLADGSALPTWLTFDANTSTFSGTPPTGTGNLNLQVIATDNGGLSVADAFSVAIGSGNPDPGGNTLTGIRKITTSTTGGASNGELITNFVHAGIAGLSGDGRYVVFAADASNLVANDTNNQTDTFLHDRVNNTNIRLADGNGRAGISRNGRYVAYASKNASGNPVVAVYDTTNQTTTQVNSTSIPANMGLGIFSPIGISDDGRYISVYTGGGVSLVDRTNDTVKIIPLLPGSRVGLNNPAMSPNGTFIIYTQADFGDSASTINGIYRYDIAADTATKISSGDYSTAFISGDSRYLHYLERTGAAKKMDLTDNSVTNGNIDLLGNGVYTGNISQVSEDGQFRVIIADDSLNTVPNDNNGFKDLFITAAGTNTANQAPVVANAIADQVATAGVAFSLVIPTNAFSDPEGNPLTFSATQGDGSALPTWLTFDAATKTFSGTPPTGSPAVDIKVTATDSGNLSVSDTFRVSPTNSLTGIPGLSTVGNLFRTDSSLNGFAVNPVSQSPSQKVSEIAMFAVDDLTGKIGSLNPTDAGYLAAVLDRAKPIFSTLGTPFFTTDKREISLNPNQIYQVIEIVDGSLAQTKRQVAAGQTPSNVLFSNSSSNSPIKVIENSDNYRININNNELVLDVTKLAGGAAAIPIGAKSQDLPEGRLIDLTDYAGQTLKINITNASSAYYGNQVGFYEVKDLAGTITVNGQDLRPGDAGYAAAAVRSAILQTDKSGSQSNKDITGGKIYAPVAIANGTFNSFLTNNSNNVNNPLINDNNETFAYFNYIGANPDKIDHFRLLNNNTFGVEDVYGGGDRDFNDIKMSLTINI
jgi:hypothetical protein